MKVTFYGACQQVTGSCYLVEHGATKVLVDCGMIQGSHFTDPANFELFPFDVSTIDYVLVTHAHIDHSGRLPQLMRYGFRGQVIATAATLDFAELLLRDSAHIIAQDADRFHKAPLYTEAEVEQLTQHFQAVSYHQVKPVGDLVATFYDAGHILGSAFIQLASKDTSIVFSGDLGNPPVPLLPVTEALPPTDYLVMESTYGNQTHEDTRERKLLLASAIYETVTLGGVLLIPAFALERTQEILYELNSLVEHNDIPKLPIFIDSPLAIHATQLYRQHQHLFNNETKYIIASGDDVFRFPGLQLSETRDSSKQINHVPAPKIIIAGSGMMQGGRIRFHLKRYLSDFRNQVLIVGYQVAGSLGRQLLQQVKRVTIDGEDVVVKAKIRAIGGYSAHADQPKLLHWLTANQPPRRHIWLTHGEVAQATALQTVIQQRCSVAATIPHYGQVVTLSLS
ncbi:MAG: MBL fold metallo-hydrolase [Candidatus Kerfeldbacteria bacterium]|nr:MBL fold metallo-hydrolase [Candidatus Kerfeldbacteria bacterium]